MALVANTAPVAFGAIAIPIVTLAEITGLPKEDLGAMVGRQTPVLALIVPLILVGMVDGARGIRQAWPAAVVGGLVFAVAQFLCSNYVSVELTDIVAALLSTGAIVLLLQVWQPSEPLVGDDDDGGRFQKPAVAGAEASDPAMEEEVRRRDDSIKDPPADVVRAYSPYLIIIAIFAIAQIPAIKDALAESPWTTTFQWPGLDVVTPDGEPLSSLTYNFNWLPAAGTLLLISGLITMVVLKVSPGRAVKVAGSSVDQLKWAIVTVCLGARPGLRDEPVRPDDHARDLGGRRRRRLRLPVRDDRLAGRGRDRLGHLVQCPVRRAAGDRGRGRRHLPDPVGRGQQLGRRAGQDDLPAESRDWRGGSGSRRQGGRPVP